jgi:Family of unknown function (DUF6261)
MKGEFMFTLPLTRINLKAKVVASVEVVNICNKKIPQNAVIIELSKVIKENSQIIGESFGTVFNKEKTRQLKDLDDKRDSLFRGIVLFIRGAISAEMYPEFGNKIKMFLEKVAPDGLGIVDSAYLMESAILNNVVKVLESAEYVPIVNKLNLKNSIESLKEVNKKFDLLHLDRVMEKGESLKSIKENEYLLNQSLRTLFHYLQVKRLSEKDMKTIFNPLLTQITRR